MMAAVVYVRKMVAVSQSSLTQLEIKASVLRVYH